MSNLPYPLRPEGPPAPMYPPQQQQQQQDGTNNNNDDNPYSQPAFNPDFPDPTTASPSRRAPPPPRPPPPTMSYPYPDAPGGGGPYPPPNQGTNAPYPPQPGPYGDTPYPPRMQTYLCIFIIQHHTGPPFQFHLLLLHRCPIQQHLPLRSHLIPHLPPTPLCLLTLRHHRKCLILQTGPSRLRPHIHRPRRRRRTRDRSRRRPRVRSMRTF